MHFPRFRLFGVFAVLYALFLASYACAQVTPLEPGHPNYYPGTPLNFIAKQPRPGTFYYNDFNRYQYLYFTPNFPITRKEVAFFGYFDGSLSNSDFSGQAIIGNQRGVIENLVPGTNPNAGGDGADPEQTVTVPYPDSALGTADLRVIERAFGKTGTVSAFTFAISTVGYKDVQLSFDLTIFVQEASANYRFRASPDGGLTWTYIDEASLTNLPAFIWFNGSSAGNPQFFVDFSDHPEFDNNPDFVFQIDKIPNPETGHETNTKGEVGVWPLSLGFDRLNLTGTALPPTATPLQQWRQSHFGGPDATGTAANDADPDGDGLPNLLEYALGGLPLDATSAPRPAVAVAGGKLQLSFVRVADPALLYEVKVSNDLADTGAWPGIWSSTGAQNTGGLVTVDDIVALTDQPRRFLRLQVSTP